MSSTSAAVTSSGTSPFEFLQALASELSVGRVDLPSFPDAAARVQQALGDPDSTSERVAKVISADGGLVGKIIALSNSAMMRRSGAPISDLKLAIARLGFQHVRSAALAYAAEQLRQAPRLQHIRGQLEQFWQSSIQVAAMARGIARECSGIRGDEAMLAGLIHNIGKVYILSRAPKGSPLDSDPQLRDQLLAQWHTGIGQAIAENWGLSDEIAAAIAGQQDIQRRHSGPADLQDVLVTALTLVDMKSRGEAESDRAVALPATKPLKLDDLGIIRVMLESQIEMDALQAALG